MHPQNQSQFIQQYGIGTHNKINVIQFSNITMKDGQMTTILVHNIISNNSDSLSNTVQPNNKKQIVNMQYQEYIPTHYRSDIHDKIRCRSFYNAPTVSGEQKIKRKTYKKISKANQSETDFKQPKVIDVAFEKFNRSKSKKSSKKQMGSTQYYSLMVDSMQKYIAKVEKGKKKRQQKCEKIRNFGVEIKSISYNSSDNHRKDTLFMKTTFKHKASTASKPISIGNERPINNIQPQTQKMETSTLKNQNSTSLDTNKILSQTISSNPNNNTRPKFFTKKISLLKYDKKQEEKGIGAKFNRMLNFFSLILYSYGVYLDRNRPMPDLELQQVKLTKKKDKYYYFIGRGNNKNLLISILKKRWWWAEAEDMSSADFVWTQLKIGTVLCKQPSMNYSELEQARTQSYRKSPSDKGEMPQAYGKLFHQSLSSQFYNKLPEKSEKKLLRCMNPPPVLHNHYQANYMLGNKKALFYNITQYRNFKNMNPFQYMPLTFHVEKINSKAFRFFQKTARQSKKSMWIVKPGENSNRGQGIFVTDSLEKIRNTIAKKKKHTYIIQKYIKNNFLFQRRKFDIRTYLLLVSIGGVKKFFWYSEGYLRTCSEIYDLSDLDDTFIHLTNDAIQVDNENYGKYQKGNKITYHEFQRYLDINYSDDKYSVAALIEKMKKIAREVAEVTYFKLDPCRKQTSLQLFGMDFLVDSKFKPWLLQVNTNPCLELSSPVLERLIPRMLENMFRIAIDPVFQPPKKQLPRSLACYIPENIAANNRFELIFDSLFDRNYEWQQFCYTNTQEQTYEDEDQEFQDDGDIIKIDF